MPTFIYIATFVIILLIYINVINNIQKESLEREDKYIKIIDDLKTELKLKNIIIQTLQKEE